MAWDFPVDLWRAARRSRGFVTGGVVTLGLAIGVLVVCHRLVDTELLRPARVATALGLTPVVSEIPTGRVSFPDFADLAERSRLAKRWVAENSGLTLSVEIQGRARAHEAAFVSHTYFAARGTRFVAGENWPQRGDERVANGLGVIVTEGFCATRLAPGVDPIGLPVRISAVPMVIAGVVPDEPVLGRDDVPEVWLALGDSGEVGNPWFLTEASRGTARLYAWVQGDVDGGDGADLRGEIAEIGRAIAREHPDVRGMAAFVPVTPLEAFRNRDPRGFGMFVTASAVALAIFLIAMCNVCILGLLQVLRRRAEFGVRLALGATAAHLRRDLMRTVGLIVVGAAGVGWISGAALLHVIARSGLEELAEPARGGADIVSAMIAIGLAALAGLALLGVQVWALRRVQAQPLTRDQRSLAGRGPNHWFLAVQAALALALAIPAGLHLRSAANAFAADLGYARDGLLLVYIDVRDRGFYKEDGLAYWERVMQAAAEQPLFFEAGLSSRPPFVNRGDIFPVINGVTATTRIEYNIVGPGYFAALEQRIVHGRDITLEDRDLDDRVVVINEAMARRFWPGENPVGRSVLLFAGRPESRIIGVTQDFRDGYSGRHTPTAYVPLGIGWTSGANLFLRHHGSTAEAMAAARAMLAQVDPMLEAREMISFEDNFRRQTGSMRAGAQALALLASLALGLAAVGTYAIAAFATEQRRYEIAVRLAVGAERRSILMMLVTSNRWPWLVGLTVGAVAGWLVCRFSEAMLFDLEAFHGPIIAAAMAATAVISVGSVLVAAVVHYPRKPFELLRA